MKRYLTLLILPLLLLATSCTKTYQTIASPNQTVYANISGSTWTTADGGKTYSATINVPQIDSYFNQHGAVLVYVTFGNNVYEQIAEVYNGVAYSFSHNVGKVEIDIQSSNGTSTITPPGSLGVKIVLVDSN